MKVYIRATGIVSPQKTFGHPPFLADPVEHTGNRLHCLEPDYKSFIDVRLIRRMSRIIKMGVAAAMECLLEAKIEQPDAIITGTAYGCMEDTGNFLARMIENKEELLTPTSFIQSTHNTVGAQIALMLSCHRYNNTFVHRGFSFESALLDSTLQMLEGDAGVVLAGSVDEITDTSHAVLSRFGLYRNEAISNFDLLSSTPARGSIAGEGAAFFLLSKDQTAGDYAKLDKLQTFYKPQNQQEIAAQITSFLTSNEVDMEDIDIIITGKNGDAAGDRVYNELEQTVFAGKSCVHFKQLCGEYPTATSFAMWMAACILKNQRLPEVLQLPAPQRGIKKILIYNHYLQIHHSLFLLSAC